MRIFSKNIRIKSVKIPFNRYVIVITIAALWILFFDNNNFINFCRLRNDIGKLEKEKEYYIEKIKSDKEKIHELRTNRENLEKFAREQYLMKRTNEDIYLIIDKKE